MVGITEHPAADRSVAELLATARAALQAVAEADLHGMADDELSAHLLELQRLRGALDVAEAQVLATWDRRRVWRADGARVPAAWLASRERIPMAEARRRLRHARATVEHPAIAEAWAAGEIDRTHVTSLLAKETARTERAFERDLDALLGHARRERFRDFRRRLDVWELRHDPDGAEQRADEGRAAREVHLAQTLDGMWVGRTVLDPVDGQIVADALKEIEEEMFEADWAAARERLGREPTALELERTPAQRRADALVEMAIRARTVPADGRRPAPLFTVVVGLETLTGPVLEMFNRTVISPGTAAAHLTAADIERVVFDSPSRVIDVGERRRFFTGALRRAIEVRDRVCYHPMCEDAPERPQIDHVHEHAKGGPTTQANGRLACAFHNRWRVTHPDPGDDPPAEP